MSDLLDERAFYELMQTYRWSKLEWPADTVEAFEAVKDYIREHFVPLEPDTGTAAKIEVQDEYPKAGLNPVSDPYDQLDALYMKEKL